MNCETQPSGPSLEKDTVYTYCLEIPESFNHLKIPTTEVLTPHERDRCRRYRVQHRRNYLILSRILFQVMMSKHQLSGRSPWWVEPGVNGKPHAMSASGKGAFHVNTSITAGMIIWSLSLHGPIGCDVEMIGKDLSDIAESHFATEEVISYQALSGPEKTARFFQIWTLKEAIMKADGRGLFIPLDSFSFHFDIGSTKLTGYEVSDPKEGPASHPWRFHSFQPKQTHQVAVAVHSARPIQFHCQNIQLAEFDCEMVLPWRFLQLNGNSDQDSYEEFGVFKPTDYQSHDSPLS